MKTNSIASSLRTLALTLALCVPGPASAESQSGSSAPADDAWVPVKHLEFTPDEIEGGVCGPGGELITSVPRAEHSSLIEIRKGFESEIVKTMEDM